MPTRFRLAHYEISEELGHGGMGVVYLARDTKLGRQLAIKILPSLLRSDPERRGRFLREARAAAALNHPNIATVYEVGEATLRPVPEPGESDATEVGPSTCLYIAMELVPGEDLHDLLARGPVPRSEALTIAVQIVEGLDCAHKAGIIHRDLKPRNIRVTPEGRVKILDFGLAKVLQEDAGVGSIAAVGAIEAGEVRTMEGMIVGTVPYMAPEQIEGRGVDARSDLFAFGVVLYQMIAGCLPFAGLNLVQYVRNLARKDPQPLVEACPDAPADLVKIVDRLLARESGERYASAEMVVRDLRSLLGSGALRARVGATGLATQEIGPEARSLYGRLVAIISALLLVATIVAVVSRLLVTRGGTSASLVLLSPFVHAEGDHSLAASCGVINAGIEGGIHERGPSLRLVRVRPGRGEILAIVSGQCYSDGGEVWVRFEIEDSSTGEIVLQLQVEPQAGIGKKIQDEIAFKIVRTLAKLIAFKEAVEDDERAIAAARHYLRGMEEIEAALEPDDYQHAIRQLQDSINNSGPIADTFALLSEASWMSWVADPPFAEKLFRDSIAMMRSSASVPSVLQIAAEVRFADLEGSSERQILAAERAVADFPDSPTAQHLLGITYFRSGRPGQEWESAEEYLLLAIRMRPGYWRYWNDLARIQKELGLVDKASSSYEIASSLAPESAFWPSENRGVLALEQGDFEVAERYFSRIPEYRHTGSFSNNVGLLYLMQGRVGLATRYFEKAVRAEGGNLIYALNLGDAFRIAGRQRDAKQFFQTALGLINEDLSRNPEDTSSEGESAARGNLRSRQILVKALLGACGSLEGVDASHAGEFASFPATRDVSFSLARAFAICGNYDMARGWLEAGVSLGLEKDLLELYPEFKSSDVLAGGESP